MTAPVSVDALAQRALRSFEQHHRGWAAGGEVVVVDLPLHPPTERAALVDLDGASWWANEWLRAEAEWPIEVAWDLRRWSRIGSQLVPVRVTIRGAAAVARVAGREREWRELTARMEALRELTGPGPAAVAALRSNARTISALEESDLERLIGVLTWLREHPGSGRVVRELPIRGIDTKWIERRRGLVTALHGVITGAVGLGLRENAQLIRMRALDPRLAPGGLADVTAPVDDLAALPRRPQRVFVFENLATVLAMPPVPGAVVLDGGGHRVDLVARLPWARRVTYWGDLDTHGFAILHRLRASGVDAASVLMDAETLLAHRDLWVNEPEPTLAVLDQLNGPEEATLRLLGTHGNVRLEQERVPWDYAIAQLMRS